MATFTRDISDSVVQGDSVANHVWYVRAASDAVALSDAVSRTTVPPLVPSKVRALNDESIRIDFNDNVVINAALTLPASYAIAPVSPGAALVVVRAVSLPLGQPNPAFVELDVTEMTDGAVYQLTIVGALVGLQGGTPTPTPSFFAGAGRSPQVYLVLAVNKNQVRIQFTEVMKDNAAIRNIANYVFDGGLSVTGVVAAEGSRVTLATSDQTPGALYNLTVRGILAAKISDVVTVTDVTSDPGAFPPGLMTENGSPMTENGAYMTET